MIPRVRQSGVLVHHVDDVVVVYDTKRRKSHRLNRRGSAIWQLVDGKRSTADIAVELDLDESFVSLAVAELARKGLLEVGRAPVLSRRSALIKVAAGAAVALGIPALATMVGRLAREEDSGLGLSKRQRRYGQK